MMQMLESHNVKYQVVLTKCDLVEDVDIARRVTLVKDGVTERNRYSKYFVPEVLMISSHQGGGLRDARLVIAKETKKDKPQ